MPLERVLTHFRGSVVYIVLEGVCVHSRVSIRTGNGNFEGGLWSIFSIEIEK